MTDQKPTAVGAFIFAGGLTAGVSQHFDVLAHLEDDDYGTHVSQLNFPDLEIRYPHGSWHPEDFVGGVDFVYGNPPCATFSVLGKTARAKVSYATDERVMCWRKLVDLGRTIGPTVLMGESVPQFLTRGWDLAREFAQTLMGLGYSVTFVRHDGKFLGLPQQRRRVALLAHKVDLAWLMPTGAITLPSTALEGLEDPGRHYPLQDEIVEMAHLVGTETGKNKVRDIYFKYYGEDLVREHKMARPRFLLHRISFDRPLGTVFDNVFIHPTEARLLGINEYSRLCGYPDWFKWPESDHVGAVVQMMVRAVLPPVGEYFAGRVAEGLRVNNPVGEPYAHLVTMWASSTRITNTELITKTENVTDRIRDNIPF